MSVRCVTIKIANIEITAHLRNTSTADAIYACVPFESTAQTWGDEVYFTIPKIDVKLDDDASDVVTSGELAFWLEGNCIAIGFGPTPISRGDEIRLAAKTNIWADSKDNLVKLKSINTGALVQVYN